MTHNCERTLLWRIWGMQRFDPQSQVLSHMDYTEDHWDRTGDCEVNFCILHIPS